MRENKTTQNHGPKISQSHMLHVWNMYLQNWVIIEVSVGKYSIHGAYGSGHVRPSNGQRIDLHRKPLPGLGTALRMTLNHVWWQVRHVDHQ